MGQNTGPSFYQKNHSGWKGVANYSGPTTILQAHLSFTFCIRLCCEHFLSADAHLSITVAVDDGHKETLEWEKKQDNMLHSANLLTYKKIIFSLIVYF